MLENKVYILDNLIPKNYQDFLENIINTQVPFWLKTSNSSGVPTSDYIKFYNIQDKLYDGPQMIHYLINKIEDETLLPSVYYELISPIFHYVQSYFNFSFTFETLRSKINLKHLTSLKYKSHFNPPHIDITPPLLNSWILIYYVNDSDGDTIIFNEKYNSLESKENFSIQQSIFPQKGKILLFPSDIYHSANFPTSSNNRIIINNVLRIFPIN